MGDGERISENARLEVLLKLQEDNRKLRHKIERLEDEIDALEKELHYREHVERDSDI